MDTRIPIDILDNSDVVTKNNIDSVIKDFTGAASGKNGVRGFVPAPSQGDQNDFLRGDGTWASAAVVDQAVSTANDDYPVLLVPTADASTSQGEKTAIFAAGVTVNPSTGAITANSFNGDISGNADTATSLASSFTIQLTGDVSGSTTTNGTGTATITTTVADDSHNHVIGNVDGLQDALNGKAFVDHKHAASDIMSGTLDPSVIPSIDASKITSGTIDIERLPAGALERCVVVEGDAGRFALTKNDVQTGDTVKQVNGDGTSTMYFVVDDTKLNSEQGYEIYTAGAATSVPWSGVTDKPESFTPASHASTATTYGVSDASKYGHAMATSTTPKAPAATAVLGDETSKFARGDHVHPAQTTITGNAGTATKFASNQSVTLTGDVTGSASSQAGWSVATTLANSGVTAGTFGNTSQQTPSHGETFNIPYVTVDSKGRVTAGGTTTVKLPTDQNTDTKVTQTVSTDNAELPLLAKDSNATATVTATSKFAAAVKLNPSTGTVTATKFVGPLTGNVTGNVSGNAGTATKQSSTIADGNYADVVNVTDGTNRVGTIRITNNDGSTSMLLGVHNESNGAPAGLTITNTDGTLTANFPGTFTATSISGNASSATKLSTARKIDGVEFNGTADISHYGSCSTAAETAEKTVSLSGYKLVAGSWIAVKFTVTNTAANPTLNVNSTGAKPIYYRGAAISAGYIAANRTYLFVYNGTQYELIGDLDTNTTYGAGTGLSLSSNQFSLSDSGVTAGTIGNTSQQSPAHSGTFNIPYVTVDAKGRVTGGGTTTVKLPSDNNTDTKVNVTLGTTTKAYLLGTSTTPTSTAQGVTSIADTGVYLDTTAGRLTAGSFAGNGQNITLGSAGALVVTDSNSKLTTTSTLPTSAVPNIDAAKITSGTIDIARLPAGALERCVVVDSEAARFALTTDDVQKGDTVKQKNSDNTYTMYFVVDDTKLDQAAGYEEYTAGTATSVPWSGVTGKPSSYTPSAHATSATTYGVSSASNYGHAMASSTTPKAPGTAAVGSETAKFARGDHVHPLPGTLATARTIDGVDFNGSAAVSHFGSCSTAAGTTEKTVSCTNYKLVTGSWIAVKFTVTNTAASPTLNVNSTGAKAIYYRGSAISAGYLAANRTYLFVYNGSQYELIGDLDTNTTYTAGTGLSLSSNKFSLANSGVTAGTYNTVTVDATGRATAGSNVSYCMHVDTLPSSAPSGLVDGGILIVG